MTVFWFILGLFQCFFIWILGRCGKGLADRAVREQKLSEDIPPVGWPPCAIIVPVAGTHPNMGNALRSLAEQDYPDFLLCLVTASETDPACAIIRKLQAEYSNIAHVVAGFSHNCGQKNFNQLAGVNFVGERAPIYAFCDSTHIARPDFLRCLVGPICRGEAGFTTGYHTVEPQDQNIVSLAYALSVLFMRFMQGLPALAQPWGGAMAMSRHAWRHYNVAALWSTNVVDDCSLAALLQREGAHVRLCPGALLRTTVTSHPLTVWRAWLERQILFLKFCIPSQWLALGFFCAIMTIPPLWFLLACGRGLIGLGGGMAPFLSLSWLCALWYALANWRNFLPNPVAISRWLTAFFCASFMFAIVYISTIFNHTLIWHNVIYSVGKDGHVLRLERR